MAEKIIGAEIAINKKLSKLLNDISDHYKYLGTQERFRASAYANAAKTIANLEVPIFYYKDKVKELDALKFIGKGIAGKIIEFINTGAIKLLEELKQQVPEDLMGLLESEGIGPVTIRTIYQQLHINKKSELLASIDSGRIATLKGFGKRKIALLKASLKNKNNKEKRIPLQTAIRTSIELLKAIRAMPNVEMAKIAGSIRRRKTTIGDIDIVMIANSKYHKSIINNIIKLPFVNRVILKGDKKASIILKEKNIQADIRIFEKESYAPALLYFTGPKEHNITLRSLAKRKGLKINEYGVFKIANNEVIKVSSEEEIYKLLNSNYILPHNRSGNINVYLKDEHYQEK